MLCGRTMPNRELEPPVPLFRILPQLPQIFLWLLYAQTPSMPRNIQLWTCVSYQKAQSHIMQSMIACVLKSVKCSNPTPKGKQGSTRSLRSQQKTITTAFETFTNELWDNSLGNVLLANTQLLRSNDSKHVPSHLPNPHSNYEPLFDQCQIRVKEQTISLRCLACHTAVAFWRLTQEFSRLCATITYQFPIYSRHHKQDQTRITSHSHI